MAISDLIPVFERVQRPNLRAITGTLSAEKLHPRKFILIIGTVFALCFVLQSLVSIFVTSDAFKLQDLKSQRNLVQDQRDAILIKVNQFSSPEYLAVAASKIGMKPVENISYIDMSSK